MVSYLQTYTLGSIIRSSFAIHFRNWVTLFAIYAVPIVPVYVLKAIVPPTTLTGIVFAVLQSLASMFATYPATVAVSEYCLGIKPSFARSYARVFAAPGRLIKTALLSFAIIFAGYIALIIPGIVFALWYLFVGPVVVLEGLGGRAALRRSRELGRGFYARNFGVAFVSLLLVLLTIVVLGAVLGIVILLPLALTIGMPSPVWGELIGAIAAVALSPIYVVAFVLLYYDMRVRKEGYGAAQLAEDIRI
jgi:hypothetical protein